MRVGKRRAESGYTFVAVLIALALIMLGLSIAGPLWSQQIRREREQELLRIGSLYADAIARYHDTSPGSLKQYPVELHSLLLDTRFVGVQRHLRQLYTDPVSPGQAWATVQDTEGRIIGVYSRSGDTPLGSGTRMNPEFASAKHYSDWKFIAKVKS